MYGTLLCHTTILWKKCRVYGGNRCTGAELLFLNRIAPPIPPKQSLRKSNIEQFLNMLE